MKCVQCKGDLRLPIELGEVFTSHDYYQKQASLAQRKFELGLVQCQDCGLIQLGKKSSVQDLVRQHSWLKCTEPEGHFPQLLEQLSPLIGKSPVKNLMGLSSKDQSLLDQLIQRQLALQSKTYFEGQHPEYPGFPGVEVVGELICNDYHPISADFIVARHILEHTHNLQQFLSQTKKLLAPDGKILFEVPDCIKYLEALDYTMIWEEHTLYFTPNTLKMTLERAGFDILFLESYDCGNEQALVALVEAGEPKQETINKDQEDRLYCNFYENFEPRKRDWQNYLRKRKEQGKKIAVFGAGHIAEAFLNFYEVGESIDLVVDDNPNLEGLAMPKSHIPIFPSRALIDQNIDECILTLAPDTEKKVLAKQEAYLSRGGKFISLFPHSQTLDTV